METENQISSLSGNLVHGYERTGGSYSTTPPTQMYNINIESMNRGYLVTVGCQRVALSTRQELKDALNAYIDDPAGYTEKYAKGEVLKNNQ